MNPIVSGTLAQLSVSDKAGGGSFTSSKATGQSNTELQGQATPPALRPSLHQQWVCRQSTLGYLLLIYSRLLLWWEAVIETKCVAASDPATHHRSAGGDAGNRRSKQPSTEPLCGIIPSQRKIIVGKCLRGFSTPSLPNFQNKSIHLTPFAL